TSLRLVHRGFRYARPEARPCPARGTAVMPGSVEPAASMPAHDRATMIEPRIAGRPMTTPDQFNEFGAGYLPGHLGIVITHMSKSEVRSELPVRAALMAPNGFLHA